VKAGEVRIHDRDVTNAPPAVLIEEGIAYVPEDRHGVGSVPNLSVAENLGLRGYRSPPIGNGWRINRVALRKRAEELVETFDILTPSIDTPSRLLSGGNLQKMILARELSGHPRVVIAVHPTRGLDVGATEAVHRLLLQERDQGAGVLLISEDLDEILSLADRIAVIYEGRIMSVVDAEQADIEELGLQMAGTKVEARVEKEAP
jgi:simple sugar transport system ATP-binding protein